MREGELDDALSTLGFPGVVSANHAFPRSRRAQLLPGTLVLHRGNSGDQSGQVGLPPDACLGKDLTHLGPDGVNRNIARKGDFLMLSPCANMTTTSACACDKHLQDGAGSWGSIGMGRANQRATRQSGQRHDADEPRNARG